MNEEDKSEIQAICLKKKVIDSRFIDTKSIVIGYWTRYKCQYGCIAYGKSLCCPPNTPTPDETKKIIDDFKIGLLVRFGGDMKIANKTIVQIEREIFLKNYYKVISFSAGFCYLCNACSLSECRNPKMARPSMEACGIDVYKTAIDNDFPINVLKSRDEKANYYGLILIE